MYLKYGELSKQWIIATTIVTPTLQRSVRKLRLRLPLPESLLH